MELPEDVIADWVGRAGDRRRLREIPLMFAIKPDPALLEEWADDAVKASRYALEATLRVLLTPFQQQIANRTQATPVLALAGTADALLGPTVQRAIAAKHPGSQVIELDCCLVFWSAPRTGFRAERANDRKVDAVAGVSEHRQHRAVNGRSRRHHRTVRIDL